MRVDDKRVAARAHGTVVSVPCELAPGAAAVVTLTFKGQPPRLREADEELAPGMSMLAGRPRTGDRAFCTFAVGPHGAVLVDWYPQAGGAGARGLGSRRAGARWAMPRTQIRARRWWR